MQHFKGVDDYLFESVEVKMWSCFLTKLQGQQNSAGFADFISTVILFDFLT